MATNLPPTQLFSTEISTYSLTLWAHEPGEMNWSQELTYIHSTSCFIVFRKMFRKRDLNPWNWWFCPWRRLDVALLCEHVRPAVRGLEDRPWCQAAKRSPGKERSIKYISNARLGWPMRATHFTINHLRLLMTTIVLHLEPWSMFLILLRNLPAVFIFIQFILLVCIHCWVDTHIRAWLLSNSFWENIILARDLEVLKSIYLFRLTFQTNTVRHQNIGVIWKSGWWWWWVSSRSGWL